MGSPVHDVFLEWARLNRNGGLLYCTHSPSQPDGRKNKPMFVSRADAERCAVGVRRVALGPTLWAYACSRGEHFHLASKPSTKNRKNRRHRENKRAAKEAASLERSGAT